MQGMEELNCAGLEKYFSVEGVRFEEKRKDPIRGGKRVFIEDFRRRITCPYYQIPSERKGI